MQPLQFILQENVVSDNILELAPKGYIFKGNYIAVLKEYSYLNAWQDKEKITRFRSKERIEKYLDKNYPGVDYLDFHGTYIE